MPPWPFGVTRDGELIQSVSLRQSIRTGIEYNDPRVELGLVSEFEEREAATFSGTPWFEWERLDLRERAAAVAHYRIHHLIELHANEAVSRESERRMRAKRAGVGADDGV